MSGEMKVPGLDDLEARLLELGPELGQKTLATAVRKAMQPVLEDAKARVPIWSGALRDSIKLTVKKLKAGDAVVVGGLYIGEAAEYDTGELPPARRWHFIELGTSKYAAHPFLRPAIDGNAPNIVDTLKSELDAAIIRAARKKAKAGT